MQRKRITDRTKLAAALLDRGDIPYSIAKTKTEDWLIGCYHFDHNILHETKHPDRDAFWNLTPMLIHQHLEKTKRDQSIIAKSRRIRKNWAQIEKLQHEEGEKIAARVFNQGLTRKLRSRGFDKTRKRKMRWWKR